MPGMDGVQLIQQAQRRRPQLPAIILAGLAKKGAEGSLGRVIDGPFAILPKPINARQLVYRVAKLVDESQRAEPLT
jgi:CheY-like chemotaxis protein